MRTEAQVIARFFTVLVIILPRAATNQLTNEFTSLRPKKARHMKARANSCPRTRRNNLAVKARQRIPLFCNSQLVLGNSFRYNASMNSRISASEVPQVFPHTRWSVVLAATRKDSPESAAALEVICRAYWYPLYAYVRRCGQSAHDAQDLTQEFFCRLLEKRWLDSADPGKGRLRTFLIVMLKNFMSNEWRRASTHRQIGRAHV